MTVAWALRESGMQGLLVMQCGVVSHDTSDLTAGQLIRCRFNRHYAITAVHQAGLLTVHLRRRGAGCDTEDGGGRGCREKRHYVIRFQVVLLKDICLIVQQRDVSVSVNRFVIT